jgi:hypothetical protein
MIFEYLIRTLCHCLPFSPFTIGNLVMNGLHFTFPPFYAATTTSAQAKT